MFIILMSEEKFSKHDTKFNSKAMKEKLKVGRPIRGHCNKQGHQGQLRRGGPSRQGAEALGEVEVWVHLRVKLARRGC